ncbi:tyrosine-type recombinase/integrase [Allopontixanthobacter sediminis]|uniref:Tyrosine-type recombinase/integrase n=1 Tax=Allopontixanthobacter sediminis TaxID=1689985 RepID=A0A845B0M8_9SPHN|nr:site-specific integrase [Allopontixanthobacter sediminis]MXP44841.1 tyrosine-type recombinase/integrase [Allopontixanthobacter sediminis]
MRFNPDNERVKRRYFHELREADGLAEVTIDHAARAIAEFERFNDWAEFKLFRSGDASNYRKHLLAAGGKRASALSNRSTVHTKLMQVQKFFTWLSKQPGFKSRISPADAKYFKLSNRDRRLASERPLKPTPTVEQVKHVILSMPAMTDLDKRDRALIALLLLTGIRVSAAITLKLKHVRTDGSIFQDAREVKTKFAKTQTTYFFPVGEEIRQIFADYVSHLRKTLLWGDDDPLFPMTHQALDEQRWLRPIGLLKQHWKTSDPVRHIFKRAFEAGGVPYYTPHSIRRTLARLGERLCNTPEQMKAWSQNLGHDELMTTFSYGAVPLQQQATILSSIEANPPAKEAQDLRQLAEILSQPSIQALINGINNKEK